MQSKRNCGKTVISTVCRTRIGMKTIDVETPCRAIRWNVIAEFARQHHGVFHWRRRFKYRCWFGHHHTGSTVAHRNQRLNDTEFKAGVRGAFEALQLAVRLVVHARQEGQRACWPETRDNGAAHRKQGVGATESGDVMPVQFRSISGSQNAGVIYEPTAQTCQSSWSVFGNQ